MEIIRLESKLIKVKSKIVIIVIIKLFINFLHGFFFNFIYVAAVNVFGNPCELLHADRIPILIYSLKEDDTKGIVFLYVVQNY